MYSIGEGASQNYVEAMKWLKLSAEQGNAKAQYGVGALYALGQGIPQNDAMAAEWFQLSAAQGYTESQHNLALAYYQGRGLPKNDMMAYVWTSLAAAQGFSESFAARDEVIKLLSLEQLSTRQEIAARCFASNYKDCDPQ
jgi:TPR repeat protein